MIQYTNDRNKPIYMSLGEALQLQQKLSLAISTSYFSMKQHKNPDFIQVVSLPMTLYDDGGFQRGAPFVLIVEGE